MMLKKKSKVKLSGVVFLALLFGISYIGISFYYIPEKASAITWFPNPEDPNAPPVKGFGGVKAMQDFQCSKVTEDVATGELYDKRDYSTYAVGKLSDGKCWMKENLRLNGGIRISKADSDISGDYTLPASSNTLGTNQDVQQMQNPTDNKYGAYYSWCTATAGTCSLAVADGVDAPSSICPKGWLLPSNDDIKSLYRQSTSTTGWTTFNDMSGRWLGGNTVQSGGAFFPAAGIFNQNGTAAQIGSHGYYWTRTSGTGTQVYAMMILKDYITPTNSNNARYYGYSMRCIAADGYVPENSDQVHTDSTSGSISVKVANTLSIDAVSGMEKEVDSTSIANGTITATIAANTSYKVLLSAEKTSLTSASTTNDAEIPALPTVQAGTNAWGILNADNTTYSAITNQEKEYYHTTTPSTNPDIPGTTHTFNIGISVSPSLPSDTYSTDVTITAAAA